MVYTAVTVDAKEVMRSGSERYVVEEEGEYVQKVRCECYGSGFVQMCLFYVIIYSLWK